MKKFIAIFLAVLPFIAFTACSDDDKNDDPGILGKYYDVEYPTDYIELKAGGVFVEYMEEEGEGSETITGTYVYDEPNITFSAEGETMTGTISGNRLTLDGGVYEKR